MTDSGGHAADSEPGLLGVEIGRNKVRLVLLDREGRVLRDAVERPIAKAGGPRDPIEEEFSTRSAIEAGVNRLDLDQSGMLLVGATIGFANCGVGSGPAIRDWLSTLSDEIGEPLVYSGDTGVSYAPASCVDFVRRVFEPIQLHLDRVELAPVAASRCLGTLPSGAMSLGSGVAWSARILNNHVLEAFETIDGSFDEVLQFSANGRQRELDTIDGVDIDPMILRSRAVTVGTLAPSVGVAVGLLDFDASNLLDGARVTGVRYAAPPAQVEQVAEVTDRATVHQGLDQRGGPSPTMPGADEWEQPAESAPVPDPFAVGPGPDDFERLTDGSVAPPQMDDTHNLRKLPRRVERSREFVSSPPPVVGRPRDPRPGHLGRDDLGGIEAFAHPEEVPRRRGFHVSDFILGALGMLAIMLIVALVVL